MDSNNRVNYGIEFKLVIVISCLIIASAIAATLFFGFTADEGKEGRLVICLEQQMPCLQDYLLLV